MYLNYIHLFRGIAIISIVIGHCIPLGHWQIDSLAERFFQTVITNATVYFVFISGFLFHHIYCQKFNFRKFLASRAKNVLVPYLALSLLPIALIIVLQDRQAHIPPFFYNGPWATLFFFLVTGCTFAPFWYIPMAMIFFVSSPLIVAISRHRSFPVLIAVLFLVSLVIHRPIANLNPLHSALYFLPVYLLGIFLSIHRDRFLRWLEGRLLLFLAGGLLCALIQSVWFANPENFQKNLFELTVPDVNLMQKLFFIFLIVGVLVRFGHRKMPILHLVAEYSFPIYFIHTILLDLIARCTLWRLQGNILTTLALTLILILVSMAVAKLAKLILGTHSRYLVGR